ncbi:MAG: hypothetical protein OEY29_14485 [Gammaproteobacteria bacterium]|nr:hypothetical protein [Gammaproteobacteria bacterium]
MFPVNQRDPETARGAKVTGDKEMLVISSPYPPLEKQKVRPFRQYFTDDGLITGSNDMGIDGSVTNQDFYISAHATDDRYITALSFIMGYGATAQPFQFADTTALTNGCRLFYRNSTGEYDIHEGLKSNQDMLRLTFNQIPTSWEVRGIGANNDYGYFVSFDLTKIGLPFGIKLDRGTTQRLTFRIRDDLSVALGGATDSFNCIAYGFDRFL